MLRRPQVLCGESLLREDCLQRLQSIAENACNDEREDGETVFAMRDHCDAVCRIALRCASLLVVKAA